MRLAETFYSLNGEGYLAGQPTFFVRFAGCSVRECPLHPYSGGGCDTDWQYSFSRSAAEVVAEARKQNAPWICITGGEPADQLSELDELIKEAHAHGIKVTVQTSGKKEIAHFDIDWLVVSPKTGNVCDLAQKTGHELKVLNHPQLVQDMGSMRSWALLTSFLQYYLQPVWGKNGKCNAEETAALVQAAARVEAGPWKLSLQQHKYWNGQ